MELIFGVLLIALGVSLPLFISFGIRPLLNPCLKLSEDAWSFWCHYWRDFLIFWNS